MRITLFCFLLTIVFISCGKDNQNYPDKKKKAEYTNFNGSYKSFNDLNDLHLEAAFKNGNPLIETNADTAIYKYISVRLPQELDLYTTDKLTHSVPFVSKPAADLLVRIGLNFRDSLMKRKAPPYKLIITSLTRSLEDNTSLSKTNMNTSQNSPHFYGATIDISWKRFERKGPPAYDDLSSEQLKYILAQVLHDLRQQEKCYVLYERRQACFHITVR